LTSDKLIPAETPAAETQTATRRRVLGVYDSGVPGPTLVALGGIHGNEPGGVQALTRVLATLVADGVSMRGRLVALAGNLQALELEQRFIDRDLNRAWMPEDLQALVARAPESDRAEDREQRELLEAFVQCQRESTGPMIFLDLHTSSAAGSSFSCMSDTLANRRLAHALPIPVILGLEECIDGAVMEFFNRGGMAAIAVEGGRHDDPVSAANLASAVWLVLHAVNMLPSGQVDLEACRRGLGRSAEGKPPVLEILHRQHIEPDDEFVMEPGFESFQSVRKGQLLARYNDIELRAPEDCRLLLPLYQGQGEDGFFLVRPVSPFWLRLACVLRRLRLQAILHWLPGVRRHPSLPDTVVVEPRVARVRAVELFHLLGYRRQRLLDGKLCFSRRRDPLLD
jgi:predicted deacylase